MCNKPKDSDHCFWFSNIAEPSGDPPSEMNTTALTTVFNEVLHGQTNLENLKEKFKAQVMSMGSNTDYLGTVNYSWLPDLPEPTQEHLCQLKWTEIIPKLHTYFQTLAVPVEQLIYDFEKEPLSHNITVLRGIIDNTLEELRLCIMDNNLKVEDNVQRSIMPSELREVCNNKTERTIRDWIIIRELHKLFEYTGAVCMYLMEGGCA